MNTNKFYFTVIVIFALLSACRYNSNQRNIDKKDQVSINHHQKYLDSIEKSIPKKLTPITGYRFIINGDFNGDKIIDTLYERYFSALKRVEIPKYYKELDYNQLVFYLQKQEPTAFLSANKSSNIDTFHIHSGGQLLGLSYLKNEGDLDGDGGDEISYVVHWADWSSVNSWHIATYKNGIWKKLYSFSIRDWQLPDLPEVQNMYYPWGVAGVQLNSSNDTLNQRLEQELKDFPGLVRKLGKGKIQIQTFSHDAAEDSFPIIDLTTLKLKK